VSYFVDFYSLFVYLAVDVSLVNSILTRILVSARRGDVPSKDRKAFSGFPVKLVILGYLGIAMKRKSHVSSVGEGCVFNFRPKGSAVKPHAVQCLMLFCFFKTTKLSIVNP